MHFARFVFFHLPLPHSSRTQGRDLRLLWKDFCGLILHPTAASRGICEDARHSGSPEAPGVTCFPPPQCDLTLPGERDGQEQLETGEEQAAGTSAAATRCCGAHREDVAFQLEPPCTTCQLISTTTSSRVTGLQRQTPLVHVCPALAS